MTDNTQAWIGLQGLLHDGLSTFVNGLSLNRASHLLYPWLDRLDAAFWKAWMHRVQELLCQAMEEPNLIDMQPVTWSAATISPQSVAGWLACLGSWLDVHMPKDLGVQDSTSPVSCLKPFNEADYKCGGAYLEPVLALQYFAATHLSDLVVGAYLHGSMSTLDYVVGSSDLDALVVIKQKTIADADRLLLLRRHLIYTLRWFYRIDYSQHHGYAVLSELDLRFYAESLFPSVLFPYLTPLTGTSSVTVRRRYKQGDPTAACRRTAAYIRKMSATPENLSGWFSLKLYLQNVLRLPTLYLQAKGTPVYKRDSFTLARPYFSDDAWNIVQKASQIRSLGLQKSLVTPKIDNLLTRLPNPWLASLIHRKVRNQVPNQVYAVLGDNWQVEAMSFVNEIEAKLNHAS